MATIRITKDLRNEIHRKIATDFNPVTQKHAATFKVSMSPEDIYEHALTAFLQKEGVERATFDGLPPSWKDNCEKISIKTVNGVDVPYEYRDFKFAKTVYAPDRMKCDKYVDVDSEALQPLADIVASWKEENKRINEEHNRFTIGVNRIMDACTTVKQAVEMWPQFVEVLPANVKSRHFEVEVRQKKAKAEIDGDLTDALSAQLVSTKISTAI